MKGRPKAGALFCILFLVPVSLFYLRTKSDAQSQGEDLMGASPIHTFVLIGLHDALCIKRDAVR